jgi:hypothetical protein
MPFMNPDARSSAIPAHSRNRNVSNQVNVGKHLLKTKVCSLFLNGRCHYGPDRCFFAHSVDEIREQPKLEKTSLCPSYRRGSCTRGASCTYAHTVEEMNSSAKKILCLWHKNGHCSHGSSCRFSHDDEDSSFSGEQGVAVPTFETESIRRKDSTASSIFSPSTTPTTASPVMSAIDRFSFDEVESNVSMSILDLFTVQSVEPCQNCCSTVGCICKVFEECSEVLRLL